MKDGKQLLPLFLLSLYLIVSSASYLIARDFNYYQEQTKALLPTLGIDTNDITFIAIHKKPLIRDRISNPSVVYINLERLEQLSEAAALFECAFHVECTTINWSKIRYRPLISHPYVITALIAVYLITMYKLGMDCDWFITGFFGLLPSCLLTIPLVSIDAAIEEKALLEILKYHCTEKLIDTIYHLLENPRTAHIAFAGFENNIATLPHHYYHYSDSYQASTATRDTIHTKQQVLLTLNRWIIKNPELWQTIKQTLKPSTITLFETT